MNSLMTPIHPDHRQEVIDEMTDLIQMLQTSEVLTYEDLDQRLSTLTAMVEVWRPTDDLRQTVEAIAVAQSAIKNYVWRHGTNDTEFPSE